MVKFVPEAGRKNLHKYYPWVTYIEKVPGGYLCYDVKPVASKKFYKKRRN